MRIGWAVVCLTAWSHLAPAQPGISIHRDVYGNLVRDTGAYSPRGVNQGPVNNGRIRNAPAQPPTGNMGLPNGTGR
ncbi:hypothetical protein [Bradyrhizobium sp.]|uniref:hypothetical protein n=1 Tax=Bradyrhizobium sp. TaxID=376 RepID=UPI003C5DBF77